MHINIHCITKITAVRKQAGDADTWWTDLEIVSQDHNGVETKIELVLWTRDRSRPLPLDTSLAMLDQHEGLEIDLAGAVG